MKVLITGAHGDIGYALVNHFLTNQSDVVAIDKKTERLNQLNHPRLTVLSIDLLDLEDNLKNLSTIRQDFDVLIHAAGVREIIPAIDLNLEKWNEVLQINLTSAFQLSKFVATTAIQSNKPLCIIYISSISGIAGEPERGAYCASKHGLIGLAKSLALEFAKYSIRVNVIAPGVIETDMTRHYQYNPRVMKQLNQNIPLSRWGNPNHIVQTADFIIQNDYITGATLVVDGGWTAGKIL